MAIESTSLVRLPPGSFGAAVEGGGVGGGQLTQTCTPTGGGGRRAYRSLQLQHRRLPRLVLKDAPGLGAVLPGVHLLIRGLPLVPVGGEGRGRREPILIK